MYFDAHNHFQDDWLDPHRELLIEELRRAGIGGMVMNGTCEADWGKVAAIATRTPWIVPSFGLHPWDCGNRGPDWESRLVAALTATPRAAVGEIGIDRWILDRARPDDPRLAGLRRAPLDEQLTVFVRQLALARLLNRPASVHCLDAWGPLLDCLRATPLPSRGFLLHAYGGSAELIAAFADLGAYFSFNGSFLEERRTRNRDAFRHVPPDRLLVETDAPAMPLPPAWTRFSLPPTSSGDAVNHPGNLIGAYEGLAQLRGLPVDGLAELCARNYRRLFLGDA
ncbi:putative deoxyribonuclease YcfH [mine drainage metagenome]|uniref:Putative deoxyribonuclease YcfH n=1 Tax=mine drainage metagenome TaxID=410659 RepID=A0A1J5STM1_9ZZZZ